MVISTGYPPPQALFPRPWPALALQLTNVHLTLQRSSVETVDHLGTGSCVPCQRQRVHCSAEHQSKHDAAVAQAVEASGFTQVADFQARDIQHDVELAGQ